LDRNGENSAKSYGGGVAILDLSSIGDKVIDRSFDNVEQLFLMVSTHGCNYIVGGVYITPRLDVIVYSSHGYAIEEISLLYSNLEMCICGNYNVPQAKWTRDEFVLFDEGSSASTFNDSASFVRSLTLVACI
ncbi:hypothetical protein HHI36_016342, partial [Cryptolaemus montrouzieri]